MTFEEIERALEINKFMQQCIELDLFDEDLTEKQQVRNLENLCKLKAERSIMNTKKASYDDTAWSQFKRIEEMYFTGER